MNNDLIINATNGEVTIAWTTDNRLVELHKQSGRSGYSVGDLYLGSVKKLAAGLNAAFVDVGYEKDGFLHYLDLGPQFRSQNKYVSSVRGKRWRGAMLKGFHLEPDIDKHGKITDVLKERQHLLVQVAKEPISTKGPRITSEITLAGRYIVLVPFSDRISVSQKIKSHKERERLNRLIQSIKPPNFGVIIRTVAENKKVAELDADLRRLLEKWSQCYNNLLNSTPPVRIIGEVDKTTGILRDILNPSFNNIYVNDKQLFEHIKAYLGKTGLNKPKLLKLYKGRQPIFEHFSIEKQIKSSFGKYITMSSGAYLIIEHTEALHVIDVNSGSTSRADDDQESNALRVNLEAAEEIARQLRLRDMGGIIVIDFIDLRKAENRKLLHEKLKECMADDRAKHNVLAPSKFGLIQLTRQRVRPEMEIETRENIPTGKGGVQEVEATILLIDAIERKLSVIIQDQKPKKVSLAVHPFIDAYLKKGFHSYQRKWLMDFKKWIDIEARTNLPLMEYHFYDQAKNELLPNG